MPSFVQHPELVPPTARLDDLRRDLVDAGSEDPLDPAPTLLKPLLRADPRMRRRIAATFRRGGPQAFDAALRRAKSLRERPWTPTERLALLRWLAQGYLITADVRYLNEFLWLYARVGEAPLLRDLLWQHFARQLDEHGFHGFPLASRREVWAFARDRQRVHPPGGPGGKRQLRIGLMGMPSLYRRYWGPLTAAGHEPGVYFVPSFPEPKRDAVLRTRVIPAFLHRWHRCPYGYTMLPSDPTDPAITGILQKDRLDIGFHKLGYILRRNILDGFSEGLINDHWSVLPYVRGYDSIEWALLFGHPLGATMHYVDTGVDTGPILTVKTYPLYQQRMRRISDVFQYVRVRQWERFLDAVGYVANGHEPRANPAAGGLQFYAIHPALRAHVERRILPLRPEQLPVP